jgi:hypothetical protein
LGIEIIKLRNFVLIHVFEKCGIRIETLDDSERGYVEVVRISLVLTRFRKLGFKAIVVIIDSAAVSCFIFRSWGLMGG